MEEKNNKVSEKKETKKQEKLSYEQLEAYAQQVTMKAQEVYKENQNLKKTLAQMSMDFNLREIDCVIKCLDHADLFSTEFLDKVVKRLEEVLIPREEEKEEKGDTEDKKEEK